MRAFIAIDLPETLRTSLGERRAAFRAVCDRHGREDESPGRWTRLEGIHLTLKFLGEISVDRVPEITQALSSLGSLDKFTVQIRGFGFFPDARRPRVFWAGVEAPTALVQLVKRVEDAMEKLGFGRESRPYNPHLTLARFKTPRPQPNLQAMIERVQDQILGQFEVSEFFLFESKLSGRSAPAEYRKVARFPEQA